MKLKDLISWNMHVSMVYAIGIWTMFGTYTFLQFKKKRESNIEISAEDALQNEHQLPDEPEKKTKKAFVETHIVVKEGFVPFSSRIYNYGKSFFDGSSDNSTGK
ncbi:small integral membrane protein 26-like [Narcine bancroftii]|uniref:small integral membrane protein 26-like n=1 Tax=Narcine bancroftii TaxID=1343680 RepID=UPI00383149A2